MRRLSTCVALLGLATGSVIAGGCGDSADTPTPAPAAAQTTAAPASNPSASASAQIRRVVDRSNSAFAAGQYKRACSYYTTSMQRKTADLAGAATCEQGWATTAQRLRASLSAAQFRAMTTYGIESVDIDGNSARAQYGPLPAVLAGVPGMKSRATLRMKRIGGHWLIASLPS
jgi:hypothetical protein